MKNALGKSRDATCRRMGVLSHFSWDRLAGMTVRHYTGASDNVRFFAHTYPFQRPPSLACGVEGIPAQMPQLWFWAHPEKLSQAAAHLHRMPRGPEPCTRR
jgi:hypothetical protein